MGMSFQRVKNLVKSKLKAFSYTPNQIVLELLLEDIKRILESRTKFFQSCQILVKLQSISIL